MWGMEGQIMVFECKRCGSCCKLIGCEQLREISTGFYECLIYADRPAICRFDYSFEGSGLSEEEYLALSYESCVKLRELVEVNTLQTTG